jgi:uncharacterized phage-like protein YoqJ
MADKALYQRIIRHKLCTQKVITSSYYTAAVMQKRNEWMVDNCNMLITVWDGASGGTANCVRYAKHTDKKIIRINLNGLNILTN